MVSSWGSVIQKGDDDYEQEVTTSNSSSTPPLTPNVRRRAELHGPPSISPSPGRDATSYGFIKGWEEKDIVQFEWRTSIYGRGAIQTPPTIQDPAFLIRLMFRITNCSAPKMADMKKSTSSNTDIHALHKEWDEASCAICMDHPHNAVLLLCSSHDKGCRSYICDTSYRHSNCLDRFKKLRVDPRNSPSQSSSSFVRNPDSLELGHGPFRSHTSELYLGSRMRNDLVEAHDSYILNESSNGPSARLPEGLGENSNQDPDRYLEIQGGPGPFREMVSFEEFGAGNLPEPSLSLKCPLCRGTVGGWKIVKEARQYLDLKQRSCSRESCSFAGNYRELRRHARRVHPTTRPADVDPSRQRAWRHLEHQREYGDIVSAIRSAMPGAIVLGDYVINNGDGLSGELESASSEGGGPGPWWTTFFLFQMISPIRPAAEPRVQSRAWTRHRRSSGTFSGRRNLWGENLLGLQDDYEDWDLSSEADEDVSPIPRRRRRVTRSRPDED
ncbi:hypothetical protein HHK36_022395 [Tetracentron sinense]|uniref:Uncharacterized protein n=1 Tax=Tetracentron sinense TaxID=13715 RepID=A0A834YRW1_TETSI|nr:hypothetical protein HHK36_022395 [Tetracentron sinense]